MGKKRKRPVKAKQAPREPPSQRQSTKSTSRHLSPASNAAEISHPVISQYYRQVVTLREYLLQRIPHSSKSRRRRIAGVRSDNAGNASPSTAPSANETDLAHLLDTTLVGVWAELSPPRSQARRRDFIAYTQTRAETQTGTDTGPASPQAEIVDFVISSLFTRGGHLYQRTQHLLSHGFQRASDFHSKLLPCSIMGIEARFPNKNAQILKQAPWTDVLALLGGNGEEIMLGLLLDCGIFAAVDVKRGVYYQLSGRALSTLEPVQTSLPKASAFVKASSSMSSAEVNDIANSQTSSMVTFSCRHVLYARPRLNAKGRVDFGMPNHVLNRHPSSRSLQQTVHVMKYIFPRQFGLQNVFTSDPKLRESSLSGDHGREEEIARKENLRQTRHRGRALAAECTAIEGHEPVSIPKRLRGDAVELVRQLQSRNRRCCYKELLHYYCPEQCSTPWILGQANGPEVSAVESSPSGSVPLITQLPASHRDVIHPTNSNIGHKRRTPASKPKVNLTDYATPAASVSAFCRAVISNLIPPGFFGKGEQGRLHQKAILGHVDRFIRLRRFENLSLDEVCKNIKITQIPWLEPQKLKQSSSRTKISLSDLQKRKELYSEFIFYLFNSIVMPLIRANFYVTESQVHRNRLFYFRHDVWCRLIAQPLADLKTSMFEALTFEEAERILSKRALGYGSLRLLPKTTGIRPILNLKRRTVMTRTWAGKTQHIFGPSVNTTIAPIHSMLDYEKRRRTHLLGSGMSSVGEIHSRLKAFKESLAARGLSRETPLYFVKLDIQSCFDTIPQQNLVRLIEQLVSEEAYHYMKYVEMRPGNEFSTMWSLRESEQAKTWRKFRGRATSVANSDHLKDCIVSGAVPGRRNTVFIDTIKQQEHNSENLLDLLSEHVQNNLVKIGKRYFRQRNGIPQGSVMSSLLCNLFYAEMERDVLGFLQSDNALLLRLTDDFLLVTLNCDLAMRFLRVMLKGQPAYGISVNPAKSLVNFAASIDGAHIPRLVDTSLFPYCGSLVDTRTLEIFRDQDRILEGAESITAALTDSLSVESSRAPGRSFHRKVLASVKLTMSPMYLDATHNSQSAVLSNLYTTLVTAAMKMHCYTKSLPSQAHPRPELMVRTIRDVIRLGYRVIRGRHGLCTVTYPQIRYLGAAAFHFVLGRKQTRYAGVLRWLDGTMGEARQSLLGNNGALVAQVVRRSNLTYGGWRF